MRAPPETEVRALAVSAVDGSFTLETELLASVNSIVATDFKVHLPGLIWRTLIAQITKESATAALANQDAFSLLNVHLEPTDISPALDRLAKRMSKIL